MQKAREICLTAEHYYLQYYKNRSHVHFDCQIGTFWYKSVYLKCTLIHNNLIYAYRRTFATNPKGKVCLNAMCHVSAARKGKRASLIPCCEPVSPLLPPVVSEHGND